MEFTQILSAARVWVTGMGLSWLMVITSNGVDLYLTDRLYASDPY